MDEIRNGTALFLATNNSPPVARLSNHRTYRRSVPFRISPLYASTSGHISAASLLNLTKKTNDPHSPNSVTDKPRRTTDQYKKLCYGRRTRDTLVNIQTRVPDLSCRIICVILRLAVLIQYRSLTDTHIHTHRQTDRHMTTAYTALSIASRGKKLTILHGPQSI